MDARGKSATAICGPADQDRSRPICLWNPSGFDPLASLGEPLRKRADLGRFVLHRIIWADIFSVSKVEGFVSLKAEYIRRFFPGRDVYSEVMGRLLDAGAITSDDRYIPGEKSLGYRLGEGLSRMRHRKIEVTDARLRKKIVSWRAERGDRQGSLRGVYRHLLDNLKSVKIDHHAAIESLLECGDFEPSDETAVQFLRDREFNFHVCDYGRVHTNLTNLKSSLRRFLMHRGEPLVNLDIRNSQPLIFAAILKDRYEFASDPEGVPDDVVRYVELVQEGRFYDSLMAEAGIAPDQRATFKRQFFGRVFFCKNHPITKPAELFGDLFPNVYAVIRDLKADDYTRLSKDLQRKESSIMIGGVAGRCMAELPHAFIATVHDSILTTARYADAIRGIMMDEFLKVDLVPMIRVEMA